MKPAHRVEYHHVERRRRGALLVEATNVESPRMRSVMEHLVDHVLISVKGEDHRLVSSEEAIEGVVAHAVGMVLRWKERHQVDDVYYTDPQIRNQPSEPPGGRNRFERWGIAGTSQHDVGIGIGLRPRAVSFISCPVPDRCTAFRVLDRLWHRQPLELWLLVDDDEVDVIAAAEAVVGDAEK